MSSSELYYPPSGTWSATGNLAIARAGHTATLLPSGKVLVAGGLNRTSSLLSSAELYDPATGRWSATGSLATSRYGHTATLLPSGKVLVAGGALSGSDSSSAELSAELYDPASGTWSPTYTPIGVNVTVSPIAGVTVTFAQVTSVGDTTATIIGGPPPPSGFLVDGVVYDISTTAAVVSPISVCLPYSPSNPAPALYHYEGLEWVPRPTSVDPVNHIVCGTVSSLSPFAVMMPAPTTQLIALGPAEVWLGLKNSDDVGTKFDLFAEVLRNGAVIGSGQLNDVPGGSSGFNNAALRTINPALSSTPSLVPGDTLQLRLSVRIAASSGHVSGTARLWFNDAAANSRLSATIGSSTNNYYLLNGFLLGSNVGPGPKKTVDVTVNRNVGGNPFKQFGTWTVTF